MGTGVILHNVDRVIKINVSFGHKVPRLTIPAASLCNYPTKQLFCSIRSVSLNLFVK